MLSLIVLKSSRGFWVLLSLLLGEERHYLPALSRRYHEPFRAGRGYGYIVIGYYSTIFEKKKTITILFFFWSKKVQKEVQKTTKMPPVTPLTVRDLSLVAWAKSNAEDLPEGKVKCKHCDGTYTFRTKKNGQNDWTQYASFATHSWPDKTGS